MICDCQGLEEGAMEREGERGEIRACMQMAQSKYG